MKTYVRNILINCSFCFEMPKKWGRKSNLWGGGERDECLFSTSFFGASRVDRESRGCMLGISLSLSYKIKPLWMPLDDGLTERSASLKRELYMGMMAGGSASIWDREVWYGLCFSNFQNELFFSVALFVGAYHTQMNWVCLCHFTSLLCPFLSLSITLLPSGEERSEKYLKWLTKTRECKNNPRGFISHLLIAFNLNLFITYCCYSYFLVSLSNPFLKSTP